MPIAGQAVEHSHGRSRRHSAHVPHHGAHESATWSPARTRSTPGPTASTTPAPSCPSTAGQRVGAVPSIAFQSEWHTPLAWSLTSTSRSLGGAANLLVGDHLLVNKFIFASTATPLERTLLPMRDIRRGDIIVFKFPEEPDRDFIKRVIGLPGETLELKNQTISINGTPLAEPYAHYLFPPAAEGEGSQDLTAAPLRSGDRAGRPLFHDGRQPGRLAGQPLLGFLPQSYIKGRALFIYWSFDTPGRRLSCQSSSEPAGTGSFTRSIGSAELGVQS